MKKGFKPYSELEAVVKGRMLVKDIKQLSPAEQTDALESFHKLICCFASKFVHYFHAQMEARLYLAALHFNENTRRSQAVTKEGKPQYTISFPKGRKGEGVAKEAKTGQMFDYVDKLISEVLERRDVNKSYSKANAARALEPMRPVPLAQSTPIKPHLNKDDIVKSHVARYNR